MSFDYTFLQSLSDYLNVLNWQYPPAVGSLALIRTGTLQDTPELTPPGVLTLHVGDNQDMAWRHERVTDHARGSAVIGGGLRGSLLGDYMEIGGGGLWRYRYRAYLQLYFTLTGEDRTEAFLHASNTVDWLRAAIGAAQANRLNMGSTSDTSLQRVIVANIRSDEAGGPGNFIWRTNVQFEALVHVENT